MELCNERELTTRGTSGKYSYVDIGTYHEGCLLLGEDVDSVINPQNRGWKQLWCLYPGNFFLLIEMQLNAR